ncbi:MAG: hypothetical protein IIC51_06580 [Planctomycetes bacterium]|nr:hypothetical protein [Planctomycetota bacterium]
MIAIGLLILIGISVLIPVLKEEERLAERRKRVWNQGVAVGGVIEAKTMPYLAPICITLR